MDDLSEINEYKRTRAVRACDVCRSRKLKCDGKNPCHRCQNSQVTCRYSQSQRRGKQPVRKLNKGNSIDVLNERMSKLESLMTTLANKLDPDFKNGQVKEEGKEEEKEEEKEEIYTSSNEESNSDNNDTQTEKESNECEINYKDNKSTDSEQPDPYFGAQSSFSVFGPRGIQWLCQISNDSSLLFKLLKIHRRLRGVALDLVTKWVTAYDKSKLVPFPSKDTVRPIVESFFNTLGGDNFFMEPEEFFEIFDLYYEIADGNNPNSKKLTSSDFLILNSVIAAGTLFLIEDSDIPQDDPRIKHYKEINETHMSMAVYYFHKVSLLSESIRTIQGILLLILNVDLSPLPQLNYSLVSTLVRQAQEIGLHRAELLTGLPEKEANKRYKLWYSVHLLDSTVCLKSGKPPVINTGDVTHLISDENSYEFFPKENLTKIQTIIDEPGYDPNDPKYVELIDKLRVEFTGNPVKLVILNYYSKLICFSSYTYDRLFRARALIGKSHQEIMDVIEELNFKLERIRLEIPRTLRPQQDGFINPSYLATRFAQDYVMLHLQYYLQMLITNRMAFKRSWLNDDLIGISEHSPVFPKQKRLMQKSLHAARSILRIYIQLKNGNCLLFNFTTFFFCSAFFALFVSILEEPKAEAVKSDFKLIQDSFQVFFDKMDFYTERHLERVPLSIIFLSLKTFLKILISIYNKNYPEDFVDTTQLDQELALHDKLLTIVSQNHEIHDSVLLSAHNLSKIKTPPAYLSAPTPTGKEPVERQIFDPIRQSVSEKQNSLKSNTDTLDNHINSALNGLPNATKALENAKSNPLDPSAYSFNDPSFNPDLIGNDALGVSDWDDFSVMNFQHLFPIQSLSGAEAASVQRSLNNLNEFSADQLNSTIRRSSGGEFF